jgi:hypothetical protein
MRFGTLIAVMLASAAAGSAASATAQTTAPAAQPRPGPTAMMLQTMCLPWMSGMDAKTLAAMAEKRGFKPNWVGNRLAGIGAPDTLLNQGWVGVRFDEMRRWCEIDLGWRGPSRLAAVAADLEASAARLPPAWRFAKAPPVKDQYGNLPQRAWTAPAGTMTLREKADDLTPGEAGQPDPLQMLVHVEKKAP